MRKVVVICLVMLTSGCLARTALDVVTMPVKISGKAVDLATTSQSEADRNRGREIRKSEAREAKEKRRQEKEQRARDRKED
jgi:predicted Holliday junction resolvase-like endonuclease